MKKIRFGPAGVPIQCEKEGTLEGIRCAKKLGLDCFEMEFVRGVKMKEKLAGEIKETREELDVVISSHAPYYINLATKEEAKANTSKYHITSSAYITGLCGGRITVVHPGYYQKLSKDEAYLLVKKRLAEAAEYLKENKIKTLIGIETMGKYSSFGKLDEIIKLCLEVEQVFCVLDFAHLRAINVSKFNNKADFIKVFDLLEKNLGKEVVNNFHVHFSEIEFGEKGERNHLVLGSKYEPDYRKFIDACIENGYGGTVICESPLIDKDAVLMMNYYKENYGR